MVATLPVTVTSWNDIPLLRHKSGSSLMYIHCFFDASDLPLEELPVLAMMTSVQGKMHTKQHSGQQLQMLVKQKIGDLSFQAGVVPSRDPDHCRVQLSANVTCLAQQGDDAVRLLGEILRDTEFTDRRLLRDLLQQSAMRTQMSMSSSGHLYAITRVGANLKHHGIAFHGSMPVLASILNFAYLWNEIRVQGGAYGCGFLSRDDGDSGFYTYRDPQPGRSLDIMDGAAEFIRQFCAADPSLTGFILSSVSSLDPLLNTAFKISVAETRYFKGTTYEDICRLYSELIHTRVEDLLVLCDGLDCIAKENAVCVVAGQSHLDGCGEKLSGRKSL